MPELKIGNNIIKRKSSIKFLGVMLDENKLWKDHIKTIEEKPKILVCYIAQDHILIRCP